MPKALSASTRLKSAVRIGIVALLVANCAVNTPANSPSSAPAAAAGTVPCGPTELFVRHAHAHLALIVRGQLRDLPARVGISATTICWLHTHDSSGIIHIEAGDRRALTLGDFFSVWAQPMRTDAVAGETVAAGESIRVTVNGSVVTADPATIVLNNKDDIVIQIGPPFIEVSPYQWPPGY
jgi:hypothetical protein